MKKIIWALMAGAFSLTRLNAQVEHSAYILGGGFGFNTVASTQKVGSLDPSDGPSSKSISIVPYGMYCINDNFAVGVGLGFSHFSFTIIPDVTSNIVLTDTQRGYSVTPMARYYFFSRDRILIWSALGISFGKGSYDDEYVALDENSIEFVETSESEFMTLGSAVGPGATIMLSEKCAFDITFGTISYTYYSFSGDGSVTGANNDREYQESNFGINWANSFGFGISFFLN